MPDRARIRVMLANQLDRENAMVAAVLAGEIDTVGSAGEICCFVLIRAGA
jgi:hypothetical protein